VTWGRGEGGQVCLKNFHWMDSWPIGAGKKNQMRRSVKLETRNKVSNRERGGLNIPNRYVGRGGGGLERQKGGVGGFCETVFPFTETGISSEKSVVAVTSDEYIRGTGGGGGEELQDGAVRRTRKIESSSSVRRGMGRIK